MDRSSDFGLTIRPVQLSGSTSQIPKIVKEAKARLDAFGGTFYTIDATEDIIVEINPGETSDRKVDNSAEDFAFWIKEAFQTGTVNFEVQQG